MKKHYIKAVLSLLLQGRGIDVVLENLTKVLKRKGHTSIHVEVLRGVLITLSKIKQTNGSKVAVAKQSDLEKLEKEISQALKSIEGSLKDAQVDIDSTLIGGYVASHNGQRIDATHKTKLLKLYRSIIS